MPKRPADEIVASREAAVSAIGEVLTERLRQSVPAEWDTGGSVEGQSWSGNDFILSVTSRDEDGVGQVDFKAGFDFDARLAWIDNFAIISERGTGLGQDVIEIFLKRAEEAGMAKVNLQSAGIGSHFWIGRGFRPTEAQGLLAKIDVRLDMLGKWLPPETIATARSVLSEVKQDPQKLRDLASLDFRSEIAQAFARPDYIAEAQSRATRDWLPGSADAIEAEWARITKDRTGGQVPKLGHLLFVSTAWYGSLALPQPSGVQ